MRSQKSYYSFRRLFTLAAVPAHFVVLNELPLTANGKALPAPDGIDAEAGLYVSPRRQTEQAMCEVWQEVLRRERVGVQDNFFSLGGDSILSIRVVSMLKERGISLEVKDIFQHQTIARLAMQAWGVRLEQGTLIDTNQIEQMLIDDRDEFDENLREIIL